MYSLSATRHRASTPRGRRCLYCQERGCPGIQSCWWSRVKECREVGAELAHAKHATSAQTTDPIRHTIHETASSAVEENLRAQICVLQREVELLRVKVTQQTSPTAYTCTPNRTATLPPPNLMSTALPKADGAVRSVCLSPPPSICVIPPSLSASTPFPHVQKSEPCRDAKCEAQHASRLYALPDSPTPTRVAELESLVRELAEQNASLHTKPTESATTPNQTHSTSGDEMAVSRLHASLLLAKEETARYRDEAKCAKVALETCEAKLRESLSENETLRRQLRERPVETITAPSSSEAMKEPFLLSALREKQEALDVVQRKLNAWEHWYQQQRTKSNGTHPTQAEPTAAGASVATEQPRKLLQIETVRHEEEEEQERKEREKASKLARLSPHRMPLAVLYSAPDTYPSRLASPPMFDEPLPPSWRSADALTIDTYALISREATLRERAAKDRDDIMETLKLGPVSS